MTDENHGLQDHLMVQAFARVKSSALGVSLGAVLGLAVFLATSGLLIRAALSPLVGPVGPHLRLLANYFPGFSVTWAGAAIGMMYGFVTGFILGMTMAALLNLNHFVYIRVAERRLRREVIDVSL